MFSFQAVHKQDLLQKNVYELTKKVEDNTRTQEYSEKELNKQIVTLDDVSSIQF